MTAVTVVMPAYNEAAGIEGFLDDIQRAFCDLDFQLIVADDCSTDGTRPTLEGLAARLPLTVLTSARNTGHGPTTVRAMRAGLDSASDLIVTVDSDGQFSASDIRRLVDRMILGNAEIIEGARLAGSGPAFRRVASYATRLLVAQRAHRRPADANTPLRVYRPQVLVRLLDVLPATPMTPNLLISAQSRLWRLNVIEVAVESHGRSDSGGTGSTWQARTRSLPSRRFLRFCVAATREWVRTPRDLDAGRRQRPSR